MKSRGDEVSISGRGVLSPWGTGTALFADGLSAGTPALGSLPGPECAVGPCGAVTDFDPSIVLPKSRGLREFDRTSLLLAGATALALEDGGVVLDGRDDVGAVVGSTFGTISSIMRFDLEALREGPLYASPLAFPNTVLNAPTGRIAALFGFRGVNATISTGETSGLDALVYGTEWLRARRAPCLVAGSAFGLSSALVRAFPDVLGEGAAVFLLERADAARERAAHEYARVAGFGTAFLPRGLAAAPLAVGAIHEALASASMTPASIDAVVAGGRDPEGRPGLEEEALRTALDGASPPICTFRQWIGDTLDASSGLEIAAALCALERGARSVLVSAFSRSGQSSFVVLTAAERTA